MVLSSISSVQTQTYDLRSKSKNSTNPISKNDIELFNNKNDDSNSETLKKVGIGLGIAAGIMVGGFAFCKAAKKALLKYIDSCAILYSNPELKKVRKWKNFNKLNLFEDMSIEEKKKLYSDLIPARDEKFFFPTISGHKPACMLASFNGDFKALSKIKNSNLDYIHLKPYQYSQTSQCWNTFMLNKNEVFKVIERNRDVYTARLNLPKNSSIEDIYSKLKPALENSKVMHDLEGLTLGFPRKSSMIFQLEQTGKIPSELRAKPEEYKKKILETLNGKDSPYKNLDESVRKDLEKSIADIQINNKRVSPYMDFVNYINEPEELNRIIKATEDFDKNFSITQFL